MNLIYSCVFFKEDYIDLIELLLKSYMLSKKDDSDCEYLIMCSPKFEEKIQTIFQDLNLNGKTWCIDLDSQFEACYSRLKIFDYSDISKYDKLLYLDSDILICNDVSILFKLNLNDLLYVYDDDAKCIMDWGHGQILFEKCNTSYNPDQKVFSSGVMLFKNNDVIKDLFGRILNHINSLFPNNDYDLGGAYDQDFIIYHAVVDRLYDNNLISKYCRNNLYSHDDLLIINHFCIPCGNSLGKYDRMSYYMNNILMNL